MSRITEAIGLRTDSERMAWLTSLSDQDRLAVIEDSKRINEAIQIAAEPFVDAIQTLSKMIDVRLQEFCNILYQQLKEQERKISAQVNATLSAFMGQPVSISTIATAIGRNRKTVKMAMINRNIQPAAVKKAQGGKITKLYYINDILEALNYKIVFQESKPIRKRYR